MTGEESKAEAMPPAPAPSSSSSSRKNKLPPDFEWGFATASYQIEGGARAGGRGPSIWDTFCRLDPPRTRDGANGDVACDHYARYPEDLDLLRLYGARAYRFSISWSRVIPLGGRADPVNEEGLAWYDALVDGLLERGVTPWVTLYHWDLPQALEDRYGGWLDPGEVQLDFERYARVCFERFGGRVKNWITFNEPWIQSVFGYSTGINAPGRSSTNPLATAGHSPTEPWIAGHAQILAHARAAALYNRVFRRKDSGGEGGGKGGGGEGRIGISLNGDFYAPWDPLDPLDAEACERRMQFHVGWFADPIFLLRDDYPACMRAQLGDRLPRFTAEDLALLREGECDFYGMNYYTSQFARHRDPATGSPSPEDFVGHVDELQTNRAGEAVGEASGLHWLRSCPALFRKHLARTHALYGKPIYVTENGCPCPGEERMSRAESVDDGYRQRYFADHLDAVADAVGEDGCRVAGYFAWSLLDNLEWSDGYGPRFGVTFTDYGTLERTPKRSGLMLRGMIEERQ